MKPHEELYQIGRAYANEMHLHGNPTDPRFLNGPDGPEVYFTLPLPAEAVKGKMIPRIMRVVAKFETSRQAVVVMHRAPEGTYQPLMLSEEHARRLGAQDLPLAPLKKDIPTKEKSQV